MIHQNDNTPSTAAAPKKGSSGASIVPIARFRVRKGSPSVQMTIRYLGKDSNPKSTDIRIKQGERLESKTQTIEGNPHATAYLRKLVGDLDELFYKLNREGRTFTAQDLSDFLFKKREWNEKAPHLLGVLESYNAYRKPEVATGHLTETVFGRYGRMVRIMKAFLQYQYKTCFVTLDSLKPVFGHQLESYFKVVKKYDNSTYVKYIRHYKTVLDYAVANEWTTRNVLSTYRGKIEDKDLVYLREPEVEAIQALKIADPSLERIRDIFIFSCYTGFSYQDLKHLKPEHLKLVNNVWCLAKAREKQKRNFRNTHFVPLLPAADTILKKYAEHCEQTGYLLPVIANQSFNDSLKGIAIAANIDRISVTTKVARTTFTTMMLNLGLDMETVSKMVGHTTATTTRKYYAELHQETVLDRVLEAFKNQ